ncbi:MAG: type III-A CRISPR-associated RAMP protein Csm3 [Nitrospirae bacterium RBG_13_39_12]|nr:MAG: type III-A CRISPR-associated RAMP protein Csm3 [Nitrospirae bacterium RBG_13_39_12]
MGEKGQRLLIGKVIFSGNIILKTGLHIGGSQESMQIGGLDLPVIRDSATNLPYIPGSSLKGKLRSTLERFGEREKDGKKEKLAFNRNIGTFRNRLFIHCCEDVNYAINCDVCRVFGSSGDDKSMPRGQKAENFPALLAVRDCLLDKSLISPSSEFTEIKIETGIDRISMSANPRRVERVLPGTKFNFGMVYSVDAIKLKENESLVFNEEILRKDLDNLLTSMEIVQNEGLGGYASRGYGQIEFQFSEFKGRSLGYFKGDPEKEKGISGSELSINEAKKHIDEIVQFLKEEAAGVIAR